jgi:hypothetical protein
MSAARRAGTADRRTTRAAGAAGSLASASSTVLGERVASDQLRLNDRVYTTMECGRLAYGCCLRVSGTRRAQRLRRVKHPPVLADLFG